jgi:hypothetical protein
MRLQAFTSLLGAGVLVGCFGESPSAEGAPTGGSATDSTSASMPTLSETVTDPSATTTAGSTATTSATGTAADTSTTIADSTASSSETANTSDDSSTGGPSAACGDGIEAVGELCFDDILLIVTNDVVVDARFVDVDADAADDIVYMIADQVVTHLGNGEGRFAPPVGGVRSNARRLEVGDIDGDGTTDLAIIDDFDDVLQVALGVGNGGFVLQVPPLGAGTAPAHIVVGDLDGAHGADVVVAGDPTIYAFVSDGDGAPVNSMVGGGGGRVVALGLGEFDGDGVADLIFARTIDEDSTTFVRLGDGDGTFGPDIMVGLDGESPRVLLGADLNGDDDGDLVHVDSELEMLYVLFGNGATGFGDPVGVPTDTEPQQVVVVDLTNDGLLDVAVGHGEGTSVWIYPNEGGGVLGDALQIATTGPVDSLAWGMANSDGVPDLLVGSYDAQLLNVVLSTP